MENKGLLKLPETWYVVVNDLNREFLEKWLYSFYPTMKEYKNRLLSETVNFIKGDKKPMQGCVPSGSQQITFADFKRLVLGEKNADDYGVIGCLELNDYFKNNDLQGINGNNNFLIYFNNGKKWITRSIENSKRQSLPLTEYLKLLPTEKTQTMEKKYEYKLRDEKYEDAIDKIAGFYVAVEAPIIISEQRNKSLIEKLQDLNVLDLFFEKIEVKELPIIGGSKPIISEDGDLIEIAGFQMDMYIIDHFKSFTLGNDVHVSESDIKQIREYLRK